MGRNLLYFFLGAIIMLGASYAYYAYQQEHRPNGVELGINKNGVTVGQH